MLALPRSLNILTMCMMNAALIAVDITGHVRLDLLTLHVPGRGVRHFGSLLLISWRAFVRFRRRAHVTAGPAEPPEFAEEVSRWQHYKLAHCSEPQIKG